MADPLEIGSEQVHGFTVLRVVGELDHQTSPDLLDALQQRPDDSRGVLVDLSACTFIDSAGSRSVALAGRDLDRGTFGVVCPEENRRVRMVLEIVGLVDLLEVRPALECFLGPR